MQPKRSLKPLGVLINMQPTIVNSDKGKESANRGQNADIVRSFLVKIGRVPLLSREEEILYAQQVKQLMQLLQIQEDLTNKYKINQTI